MDNIDIVVSGEKWVGYGIKSTLFTICDLLDSSEEKIILTIFVLTSDIILEKIKKALNRGVGIEIYIDKQLTPEKILAELYKLDSQCDYLSLYVAKNKEFIHSKIIISDYKKVYIGSANLSENGLISNYELGVLIEDVEIALDVENIIKKLVS